MVIYGTQVNDVTIGSGGSTEEWIINTGRYDALEIEDLNDDQGNYDVELRSSSTIGNNLRSVSWGDLSDVLPDSPISISDTNNHTIATDDVGQIAAFRITNNAGSDATFNATVNLHKPEDDDPLTRFLGSGSQVYLDGVPRLNTDAVNVSGPLELQDTTRATLSGNQTLAADATMVRNIDPDGARTITLPAEENGLMFIIGNRASGSEAITVEDDSNSTIATVNQDDVGIFISDGTGWLGLSAPGGVT